MELVRKMTGKQLHEELKSREAEYKEWLAAKLQAQHKAYLGYAKAKVSNVKPIRNPGGIWEPDIGRHTTLWYWTDAIWCGDISIMWPEEFACVEMDPTDEYASNEEYQVYVNDLFNEVFKKVIPKKYHSALEG